MFWAAHAGCFSGDTMVVIRESDSPIAIKDMQIGQHVQCMDSGADLANPTSVKWCEVMNWVRAASHHCIAYAHSAHAVVPSRLGQALHLRSKLMTR
jgi:hypothetical protein